MICVIDFEVFKNDWLCVIDDLSNGKRDIIINNPTQLKNYYDTHSNYIYVGHNIRGYDQYIFKGILLGFNPKSINDHIILKEQQGFTYSTLFNKISLNIYDTMPPIPCGLKALECFMGSSIEETKIPFDLDRKLTEKEINLTVKYCIHDVEQTIKVFNHNIDTFKSFMQLIKLFNLPLNAIGNTNAKMLSVILGCYKRKYNDEFNVFFLPSLQIKKYKYVIDWFKEKLAQKDKSIYSESLETKICGVDHVFAWGGLHGAINKCIEEGNIYHSDVNNFYPSILITHDLVTRSASNNRYAEIYNTRKQLKIKQQNAQTKEEKNHYKKMQLPYKLMLNALSGAMKDPNNSAYDPRNNNIMCINGQLLLLDLIEHLEVLNGFKLIQSNTDGIIYKVNNYDDAMRVCKEWETRHSTDKCEIGLATDKISKIIQKDVNNYIWLDEKGYIGECKGAYVKDLNMLDYDLPIINEALKNKLVYGTAIEITILKCNELIKFQKLVKLSNKYDFAMWGDQKLDENYFRVFASKRLNDGSIYKVKKSKGTKEKFANTPINCFINNGDVNGVEVPSYLDKKWYIDLAKERLNQFISNL